MMVSRRLPWGQCTIFAERLRLLIVQCSQFAFVCMYVCMYIRHTLIAWAWFLWSRSQTTSHVLLVQPGGGQKIVCESRNGAGATWYWSDQDTIDM